MNKKYVMLLWRKIFLLSLIASSHLFEKGVTQHNWESAVMKCVMYFKLSLSWSIKEVLKIITLNFKNAFFWSLFHQKRLRFHKPNAFLNNYNRCLFSSNKYYKNIRFKISYKSSNGIYDCINILIHKIYSNL